MTNEESIVDELRRVATYVDPYSSGDRVIEEAADMLEYIFSRFWKSRESGMMFSSLSLEGKNAEDAIRKAVNFHREQRAKNGQ